MDFDLKDEEQAKAYLDKLGIEYRFQCYHEKLPEGCQRLGDFLESMRKDFEKAAKVYKTNCDENKYGHSCFKVGIYSLSGRGGVEKDEDKGLDYFTKSCDYKYSPGCHNAGMIYSSKKVSSKFDMSKAIEYFDTACSNGNNSSCYQLSGIYLQGKHDVKKDMKKAFLFTEKSCELGNMYACANLSQMYQKGDGVERNDLMAAKFRTRAKEMYDSVAKNQRRIIVNE